ESRLLALLHAAPQARTERPEDRQVGQERQPPGAYALHEERGPVRGRADLLRGGDGDGSYLTIVGNPERALQPDGATDRPRVHREIEHGEIDPDRQGVPLDPVPESLAVDRSHGLGSQGLHLFDRRSMADIRRQGGLRDPEVRRAARILRVVDVASFELEGEPQAGVEVVGSHRDLLSPRTSGCTPPSRPRAPYQPGALPGRHPRTVASAVHEALGWDGGQPAATIP